ncbi:uncharacterized protein LOC131221359 [Magnolia sinica]|uniref:uncharacterized protein LOC131221359 n=1 Tax=Magnolia sinica TaxID=86752 RepID=UPI00265B42D8|nr:uncharacterized protein LOC131221359 [Magnolia sinica]
MWVLIATDVIAQGMDFKGINCVINYDFPESTAAYIHRIALADKNVLTGAPLPRGQVLAKKVVEPNGDHIEDKPHNIHFLQEVLQHQRSDHLEWDGVSEGEFNQNLLYELDAIRKDLATLEQQPSCTLSLETSLSKQNVYSVKSRGWFGLR